MRGGLVGRAAGGFWPGTPSGLPAIGAARHRDRSPNDGWVVLVSRGSAGAVLVGGCGTVSGRGTDQARRGWYACGGGGTVSGRGGECGELVGDA